MAWIESHQSLATHRKTLALRRLLGISRAQVIGHLHLLWWWCLDNAPDGNIQTIDPADLGIAMDWSGDANTIIGAMISVGFIDKDMHVHGWDTYAGKLIVQRASNAEKQRRHREKQTQLLLSPSRNHDVTVMSPSRNGATVPNSTQQYSTQPIKETSKEILPEWVNKETWGAFLEMRKRKKAIPTTRAIDLIIKTLAKLKADGNDPNAVLEQSIMNNYTGIFALKNNNGGQNGQSSTYRGNPSQKPAGAFAGLE